MNLHWTVQAMDQTDKSWHDQQSYTDKPKALEMLETYRANRPEWKFRLVERRFLEAVVS